MTQAERSRLPAPPALFRAGVIENRCVSTAMRRLTLAVPDDWGPPLPGQFVSLTLDRPWDDAGPGRVDGPLLRRPFSVSDFRREGASCRLEILYAEAGHVTSRLAAVPSGTEIDLLGPLGTAFPSDGIADPVLVAGGRGVAPFVFYARERRRRGRAFTFLYGARTGAELIALPDLPADRLHLASEDGERGMRGTAGALLETLGAAHDGPVLSCGPHGMLHAVAAWTRARGRRCWVSVESIFGCGVGLCGGCAVPAREGGYRWACRDGPVIDAEELDWERWTSDSTCA
jgi:dihydroorotate dehydrogenase electron transfer subunit